MIDSIERLYKRYPGSRGKLLTFNDLDGEEKAAATVIFTDVLVREVYYARGRARRDGWGIEPPFRTKEIKKKQLWDGERAFLNKRIDLFTVGLVGIDEATGKVFVDNGIPAGMTEVVRSGDGMRWWLQLRDEEKVGRIPLRNCYDTDMLAHLWHERAIHLVMARAGDREARTQLANMGDLGDDITSIREVNQMMQIGMGVAAIIAKLNRGKRGRPVYV